jgi:TRAP-type mannitol/chloroaromatic compound transport system substrate-binding protein
MKRREFLRGAAAGVLGGLGMTLAACAGAPPTAAPTTAPAAGGDAPTTAPAAGGDAPTTAPVAAEPTAPQAQAPAQGSSLPAIEWQMGTSWPISLDTIYGGATVLAERVAALTNGMFQIKTFPAGELFPGLEVLQNVSNGTVAAGHTAMYYYVGLNSAWAIATALPFGLTAAQQNAWLYHGGGNEAIDKIGAEFGVKCFAAGNTGAQMGGWWRREINSVADISGLRVRIPGLGGQVMTRLGAVVQTLPGGEIFQALSTGAVDAAEWVGPNDDEKLGLNEAADYYYSPGWWEPGPSLHAIVSLNEWEALPAEYQRIFAVAAWESNLNMITKYDALNGAALERIVAGGTKLATYNDEILSAAQKAAFELYGEESAKNALFKEIFGPWKKFRDQIIQWHATNEQPFNRFVIANPVS